MDKRAWIRTLREMRTKPRALTRAECEELITLLGGSNRPNRRPPRLIFGRNMRVLNWTAVGRVVFGFMENAETVARLQAQLRKEQDPDEREYLRQKIETLPVAYSHSEAERMAEQWLRARGSKWTAKKIQNELGALRQRARLKRLSLVEWRALTKNIF